MKRKGQNSAPPLRATRRFLKAYLTTFFVLSSYLWLNLKTRLFGSSFREERLIALHRRNAKRIEHTILVLQGLFIKVGQLFSIMTNFLPEELRSGLQNLQDAVPARPYSQIEQRIREELGGDPSDVFAAFEKVPIASASLGQVHRATTKDGRHVAVKVQHIGVEDMARADLKTIRRILNLIKLFLQVGGLDNYYHEIRAMILEELDFNLEAEHIERIARNFEGNEKVGFPLVYSELSTSRVLTLEYVSGIKITDKQRQIAAGLDPNQVACDVLTTYCQMIFIDGIYHADPHPGNILIQPDGRLIFLDFGAVGHLSPAMRQGMSTFLEAILKADETQLLRALKTMGFLHKKTDQHDVATRVIEHFHRKFQDEIHLDSFSLSSIKIDAAKGIENIADLKQLNVGFRELSAAFHVPKEWVLLQRTGLLLAGLCTHLSPEMNPAETIRPYLEEFVLDKERDWSEMLFDLTREKVLSFLSLPGLIEKAINRTLSGQVSFRVREISSAAQLLYASGHQLIYAFLATACAGAGIYFHHTGEEAWSRYAAYGAGGFLVLLFLSMFRARRFRRRL